MTGAGVDGKTTATAVRDQEAADGEKSTERMALAHRQRRGLSNGLWANMSDHKTNKLSKDDCSERGEDGESLWHEEPALRMPSQQTNTKSPSAI